MDFELKVGLVIFVVVVVLPILFAVVPKRLRGDYPTSIGEAEPSSAASTLRAVEVSRDATGWLVKLRNQYDIDAERSLSYHYASLEEAFACAYRSVDRYAYPMSRFRLCWTLLFWSPYEMPK